jgi:transcription elongation factor Elf1
MTRDERSVSVERRSPEEVFGLLSNEIRVDILRELGRDPDGSLSFSELFGRLDVADSGKFNYHLSELCGALVRKEDDYELTYAGKQVVGAIHAGTYTANATVDPIRVGWTCLLCGGEMVAEYRDGSAKVRCTACEKGAEFSFPPGSLDQFDRTELPHAFARWWHHTVERITDRFCPTCAGRIDGELVRPPGGDEDDPEPSMVEFECQRCGTQYRVSGATLATSHPVVEGFLVEHGFDVSDRHPSQVWGRLDESNVSVLSSEPLRIEVQFVNDGDVVTAEIARDGTVESVERSREGEPR